MTSAAWSTVANDREDIELSITIDDPVTPGTIEADENRLRQILENLFRDAVEQGGDGVSVRVRLMEGEFVVEDDGPGIPEADRDNIFEMGFSTASDGTGFGLAIVNQIVEAHGWEISVSESEWGGARFEITGINVSP